MHLLDQRILGIGLLLLLGTVVVVKRAATGTVLDRPDGNLTAWTADVYNLVFLLVLNPLAAILLITRSLDRIDPTHLDLNVSWLPAVLEAAGILIYGLGCLLMAWALISLGRRFQAGGSTPRSADQMTFIGPYRFLRHPMYTAALCLALGLACLTLSLAGFAIFCIYVLLIILLIPVEEDGLRRAYGERYLVYEGKVNRLMPHLY